MVKRKYSKKEFEAREVFSTKILGKSMESTGYDAYRVSPRKTNLFGTEYRKVYGATVSPDYNRGKKGAYGAKVEWFEHGYTKASAKSGTRRIQALGNYPIDQAEAKRKLMLKSKKRKR